jgi:hypothetical protein
MQEKDPEYSFMLKRIVLLEKTLFLKGLANRDTEFAFDVSLQLDAKPEVQECVHMMTVKITRKAEKEPVASIILGCTFSIPKYLEYAQTSDDGISLPDDLIQLLNTVTVGTIRGVMFSEFRGTFLNNVYLPILDTRKFIRRSN